jgi:hypothetical protein
VVAARSSTPLAVGAGVATGRPDQAIGESVGYLIQPAGLAA